MFLVLIVKLLILHFVTAFNLDTKFPIVYVDPTNEPSYFGYSIILYSGDKSNFPWLMIGAPRGNHPNVKYHNPGVVYNCPIIEMCSLVDTGYYSNDPSGRGYLRLNDSWFGGNMDINYESNRKVICGHKWATYNSQFSDFFAFGSCFWSNINESSYELLSPLYTTRSDEITKNRAFYYAQGTAGFSSELTGDRGLILGAPGFYGWTGTSILYTDSNNHFPISKRDTQTRSNGEFSSTKILDAINVHDIDAGDLTGYAVASGYFYDYITRVYVTSAPRGRKMFGLILLFSFSQGPNKAILELKQGEQLGEYFGASLTVGDINLDGLDDLIVGAPYYASNKYNEGRIYVYLGSQTGQLQEPSEGATIDGLAVNGLFGSNVRYVGDLNHDGYGDVAVAAPNELDGSGVVYIFKGSLTGLTVKPMQRIVGKDILPSIRGFGIGISKTSDYDDNKYLDIAIGAYKSGHVIVLRGMVIASVHHRISSMTKRLDVKSESFNVTACISIKSQVSMDDVKMRIRRILSADEDLGRVVIPPEDQTKELSLLEDQEICETVLLTMNSKLKKYDQPIKVSISHEFIEEDGEKRITIIGKTIINKDRFCVHCPVYDKYNSSKKKSIFVPFSLGCGDDDLCKAKLVMEPTLESLSGGNIFILGSQDNIKLLTKVRNDGERAYSTRLMITLPQLVTFRQLPRNCGQETDSSALCDVDNPLLEGAERPISVDLDMKNVNAGMFGDSIVINLAVTTSSINENENTMNITVKLVREADITISGKSGEQSYFYGNLTHGMPNFTQIFEVSKIGDSPLEEVTIKISIPHSMKDGKGTFLKLYHPEGYMEGQSLSCDSSFDYIRELTIKDDSVINPVIDANTSSYDYDMLIQPDHKITKRSVSSDEVEVFHNSTVQYERSTEGDYDLTVNRTLYINCSRDDVICSDVVCRSGPYKRDQSNAVLRIKMQLNVPLLKDLLTGKDIIVLSTHGSVVIKNPPNFVQSGDRPDHVVVSSLFVGNTKEVIQTWIIIVAVIVGLLVLLLITLGLIKAGFFKRQKKDELQNLISDARNTEDEEDSFL